jgi:hypothetical protein
MLMLCRELWDVLKPALHPCEGFAGPCEGHCTFDPKSGRIPRSFAGAIGEASEVKLVLVTAEPGTRNGTNYDGVDLAELLQTTTHRIFLSGNDLRPFHRRLQDIIELCFPDVTDRREQWRRTWFTNTVKCSARENCGRVPPPVEDYCADSYLKREVAALPQAFVIALGGKAARRHGG